MPHFPNFITSLSLASSLAVANVAACSGCGGKSNSPDAAPDAASDATVRILWKYGGGNQNVLCVVANRDGVFYVGVEQRDGTGSTTRFVAAVNRDGRELWRRVLDEARTFSLVANKLGDAWAQGGSLTRLDASGNTLWSKPRPTFLEEIDAVALGADGTFFHFVDVQGQLGVEAVGIDGDVRWTTPVGGDTKGGNGQLITVFQAPAVDSLGRINVACRPCADGRSGIAQLDPANGSVSNVFSVRSTDAGAPSSISDGVACDNDANVYFGTELLPEGATSVTSVGGGGIRWNSLPMSRWVGPASPSWLLGPTSIVLPEFVELSYASGSVLTSTSPPDAGVSFGAVRDLIAGGLRLTDAVYLPSVSPTGEIVPGTDATTIIDPKGAIVWSEPSMVASTTIVAIGRVYGIEKDDKGHGTLVATEAPIQGLEQGPWPTLRHDFGRTNSAAGTW